MAAAGPRRTSRQRRRARCTLTRAAPSLHPSTAPMARYSSRYRARSARAARSDAGRLAMAASTRSRLSPAAAAR
jgi:hypothetical protein